MVKKNQTPSVSIATELKYENKVALFFSAFVFS